MQRFQWVMVAMLAASQGCSSEPGNNLFPTGHSDAPDAQSDAQATGSGGSAGAVPDSGKEAGASGAGGASGDSDAATDAGVDTYIGNDAGNDATDATSDNVTPEGGTDAGIDVLVVDSASPDAQDDGGSDARVDALSDVRAPDAGDSGPSTVDVRNDTAGCDYVIEPVPEVTAPYALCSASSPSLNGTYQFSQLRFRRPIFDPGPIPVVPFVSGTMTVVNGATTATYSGRTWATTMGEEIRFDGNGGMNIMFTTGVQEISVTTKDANGKVGCLPQPCTWTVTQ